MLRKEEARNRRSQARTVAISTQRVPMTRGALLRSRVKGNFQARFWSSGGRGDSPTDCRKLSEVGCTQAARRFPTPVIVVEKETGVCWVREEKHAHTQHPSPSLNG
jgi:hypothetical protein